MVYVLSGVFNMSKKACLVGINKYEGSPLNGCVNDVILVAKALTEKYGFSSSSLKVLTDKEATKSNILEGLRWLTVGACPGDTLVFHYSGHGSQVVVEDPRDTHESDGFDEIICPVDLDFDRGTFIRDHELGMYFKQLRNVKSLVILDSCHSGTGLRNGVHPLPEGVKNRFIAPPISNLLMSSAVSIDDDLRLHKIEGHPLSKSRSCIVDTYEQGDAILISGCKDNQVSADAYIGSRYHGALTFYLMESLKDSNWKVPYSTVIKTVNQKLRNFSYEQEPQLEGKKEFLKLNFLE